MESLKKAHPYIQKILLLSYPCMLITAILLMIYKNTFCLSLFICACILHAYSFFIFQRNQSKQLQYLIHNCDAIIDQKELDIIDGEGQIGLLSHKLYILNERYYTLLEQMQQEQIRLRDYIEDISHQLKTPITSMRINEELLLENISDKSLKDKLIHIHEQTLKMNQLISDLLTLALLDSHSIEFHFQNHKIIDLIEDIEEDLDYLLIQNKISIECIHQNESILCDEKWFSEALKNIIKNDIEKNYNSIIKIEIKTSEALTYIIIQDQGEGFLQKDIPHLFERFYRGEKKDHHGIGIGLAMAKEIIEEHHGHIKAMNKNGALIEITIPKILAKKKI